MLYYLALVEELTCCLSVPRPIFRNLGMWWKNRTEISRKATMPHNALYLSAGAKWELGDLCALAHWVMAGFRAILTPIMSCRILAYFTCPEMICCAFCSTSAQVPIIMNQGYLPNKVQCFCGKFHVWEGNALLPALASEGLSSRTGLFK